MQMAQVPTPHTPLAAAATATGTLGATPSPVGDTATPRTASERAMDELMVAYLRSRGYAVNSMATTPAPTAASPANAATIKRELDHSTAGDVEMTHAGPLVNGHKEPTTNANGTAFAVSATELISGSDPLTLETYAAQLGLTTASCAANHMLFHGLTKGDAEAFCETYAKLTEWVSSSLDLYKYELHAVLYPVFVHCYLDLILKGHAAAARSFFLRFASDHMRLHIEELRQLSLIFTTPHLAKSEYAQQVLHSKFNVQLSLLSFELLNAFLSQEQLFLILAIVNERLNLVVTSNQPGMQIDLLEDTDITQCHLLNMVPKTNSVGYCAPEEMAQTIAVSEHPNESELAVPLTTGEYNLEYLVHRAGGKGSTLQDLHAVKINWGVLPPRKHHQDVNGDNSLNGINGDDDGSTNASGISVPGSTAGQSGSVDSTANNAGDTDKKNGLIGLSGDGISNETNASGANKADKKSGGEKSTGSDSQRKTKRARSATDADLNRRKSELDVVGPLPDRKSTFNANILERLVLREPAEMKAQAKEDVRYRAALNKSNLPSALCFSLVNSGTHINDMCFSEDVTMVGAACDDGSFRVWRNDDQPLGTSRGSAYQGDLSDVDDEEKTATLRGHSSSVYGSCFSPDNRFALTSSADSTVRLWSLAAKSNVVVYRSHEGYPVWNVRFGRYGYYFASCSMDRTARLWSTDHLTPLRVFAGHLSDVDCVEFHPNHNYLATGSSDKTVRLWDVQTGKCVRIFTGHFHGIKCLAFSRNGRYLASSGEDQYINIWDLQAGKRLETLAGHKATVTSLDFSHESTILASSSMDATVRLWDMQSLVDRPLHSIVQDPVMATAIDPQKPNTPLGASSGLFTRPSYMIRKSSIQELPASRFLLKTLRSKQTPMHRVQFTPRNLLLAGGVFQAHADL